MVQKDPDSSQLMNDNNPDCSAFTEPDKKLDKLDSNPFDIINDADDLMDDDLLTSGDLNLLDDNKDGLALGSPEPNLT